MDKRLRDLLDEERKALDKGNPQTLIGKWVSWHHLLAESEKWPNWVVDYPKFQQINEKVQRGRFQHNPRELYLSAILSGYLDFTTHVRVILEATEMGYFKSTEKDLLFKEGKQAAARLYLRGIEDWQRQLTDLLKMLICVDVANYDHKIIDEVLAVNLSGKSGVYRVDKLLGPFLFKDWIWAESEEELKTLGGKPLGDLFRGEKSLSELYAKYLGPQKSRSFVWLNSLESLHEGRSFDQVKRRLMKGSKGVIMLPAHRSHHKPKVNLNQDIYDFLRVLLKHPCKDWPEARMVHNEMEKYVSGFCGGDSPTQKSVQALVALTALVRPGPLSTDKEKVIKKIDNYVRDFERLKVASRLFSMLYRKTLKEGYHMASPLRLISFASLDLIEKRDLELLLKDIRNEKMRLEVSNGNVNLKTILLPDLEKEEREVMLLYRQYLLEQDVKGKKRLLAVFGKG